MRLVQSPLGFFLADHSAHPVGSAQDPDRAAAKRAMNAMMTMRKINIAAIEAARAKQ